MSANSTSSNSGPGRRAPGTRRPPAARLTATGSSATRTASPTWPTKMRDDIQRMYHAATSGLAAQANSKEPKPGLAALAAVPAGAISISWLLCHGFGQHPVGIDQGRDIAARFELAAGVLDADADQHQAISASNKQP